MTRKEYRAKMRAEYGADWWKKDQKARRARRKTGFAASPKKAKAKKHSGPWYFNWPTLWGWLPPDVVHTADESYVVYSHVDDMSHIGIDIHKKGDGLHVTGEAGWEDWYGPGSVQREGKIDKRGLTKAQAIAAVRKFARD